MATRPLRLLMVDDDADDFLLVRELLRAGMPEVELQLDHAESVAAAEPQLDQGYDLLLVDYRLGGESGIDLLQELKRRPAAAPAILLTGRGDEDVAVEALKAGAVDYLPKSRLNEASLRLAVRYAINLHRKEQLLHQSLQALRASEQRYRALVENTADMVVLSNAEGRISYVSPSVERVLGYSPQELLHATMFDAVHPDDIPQARHFFEQTMARPGATVPAELRLRHRDGSWRDIEGELSNHLEDPAIAAIVANAHDITIRKCTERALRDSEERYRLLFERNLAGVFHSTLEGRLIECNDALRGMLGYDSREELFALDTRSLYVYPQQCDKLLTLLLRDGQALSYQAELRRKDGKLITVLANGSLLRDSSGAPIGLQATLLDITENQKLYEQLLQSQKMEAVGKLAGGVAHDFNNLLMVISSYSELVLQALDDSKLRHQVQQVIKAAERAAGLTQQLLAFSRKQVVTPRVLDLNAVLRDFGKMLPRIIGENIAVDFVLASGLGKTKADPGQITQVVMNLAVNARDAMPEGGRLVIETANAELDAGYLRTGLAGGGYVMLAVSDSGYGIASEVLPHIFEPFFTTKERGHGTGLGLSTVYGIVRQSGGHIFVDSEPGQGTTFKIYLPVTAEPADELASNGVGDDVGGCETILLAEDDDALREAAAEFLETRGYTVLQARTAEQAHEVARTSGHIDLLLTDVVMPGMSGPELVDRLQQTRTDIQVLYMSGYTNGAVLQHGLHNQPSHFLQKPFSFSVLGKKVRELLDHAQPLRASA